MGLTHCYTELDLLLCLNDRLLLGCGLKSDSSRGRPLSNVESFKSFSCLVLDLAFTEAGLDIFTRSVYFLLDLLSEEFGRIFRFAFTIYCSFAGLAVFLNSVAL